ncbi:hypothetical protein D047_0660B, partial [Vibrio parahaemolyticus VPTS-2010_2]
FEHLNGPELL